MGGRGTPIHDSFLNLAVPRAMCLARQVHGCPPSAWLIYGLVLICHHFFAVEPNSPPSLRTAAARQLLCDTHVSSGIGVSVMPECLTNMANYYLAAVRWLKSLNGVCTATLKLDVGIRIYGS